MRAAVRGDALEVREPALARASARRLERKVDARVRRIADQCKAVAVAEARDELAHRRLRGLDRQAFHRAGAVEHHDEVGRHTDHLRVRLAPAQHQLDAHEPVAPLEHRAAVEVRLERDEAVRGARGGAPGRAEKRAAAPSASVAAMSSAAAARRRLARRAVGRVEIGHRSLLRGSQPAGCGMQQCSAPGAARPSKPRKLARAALPALYGSARYADLDWPRCPPDAPAVLVVEDEESIRKGLCDVLAFRGYAPEGVERGDEGLRRGLAGQHALVLLDVMLPGRNGFEVCRELRASLPELPILMLTARGSEQDVLEGFRAGADDYVTKPFSVAELMARVSALLRRAGTLEAEAERPPFDFGPWQVDPATRCARRGSRAVELTQLEALLAALFARERGRILSRRRLLKEVWGVASPERIETRTVDMHVAKLRKKLDAEALIQTVRGEGYRFGG